MVSKYTEKERARRRELYHEHKDDPMWIEEKRRRNRESARKRYKRVRKDPLLMEKKREEERNLYHRKKNDSEWMSKRHARMKMYDEKRYWKIRLQMIAMYGGKCACCGEEEFLFLTIDHIHGNEEHKGWNTRSLYKNIVEQNDPSKFQVLCWNCNSGRARNGGVCPHVQPSGTVFEISEKMGISLS